MGKLLPQIEGSELIKHTASIHISNTLTLLARKASNILLKNAFYDLGKKDVYSIRISDLMAATGTNSRNYQVIRDSLDMLLNTTIKWNIFGKDNKNDWNDKRFVASKMLASIKYDEDSDYIEYSYSQHLKELFQNPNIYAKLNLLIQKNFKSKHALALWEFLVEYICSSGNSDFVLTNWITIEDYRKFLGIAKDEYPEFKAINKYLIKNPIDEVNEVSDVHTTVEYKKDVRKVVAIRFGIRKNNKANDVRKIENLEIINTQDENDISDPLINVLIQEYCLSEKTALSVVKKYSQEQIKANLEYVEECRKSGNKVKNLPAFTASAIENNWQNKKSSSETIKVARSVKFNRYFFLRKEILEFYKELAENFAFLEMKNSLQGLSLLQKEYLWNKHLPSSPKKNIQDDDVFINNIYYQVTDFEYHIDHFCKMFKSISELCRLNPHKVQDISNLYNEWNNSALPEDVLCKRAELFDKFCAKIDFDIIGYQNELKLLINDLESGKNEQIALFVA